MSKNNKTKHILVKEKGMKYLSLIKTVQIQNNIAKNIILRNEKKMLVV